MNTLWLAALLLLSPAALLVLCLVVEFIIAVRNANARLNPWLIASTVAGVVMGCVALVTS